MFETIHHFQQLSSCVGTSSCGVYFNTAPSDSAGLFFGATHLQSGQDANLGVAKGFLADSNSTVSYDMATSNQGMFSSGSAINNYWSDTTAMVSVCGVCISPMSFEHDGCMYSESHIWHVRWLAYQQRLLVVLCQRCTRFLKYDHCFTQDNLRAADITDSSVAGSIESIGGNSVATNVRGGHSVHIGTTEDVASLPAA